MAPRSLPGDGNNARWLQISGSLVTAPQQQGPFFSFIPTSAGLYRFLLMVADQGELSEPDEVTVLVGSPPPGAGRPPQHRRPRPYSPLHPQHPGRKMTPEQIMSATLPRLAGGTRRGCRHRGRDGRHRETHALYESFAALQSSCLRVALGRRGAPDRASHANSLVEAYSLLTASRPPHGYWRRAWMFANPRAVQNLSPRPSARS